MESGLPVFLATSLMPKDFWNSVEVGGFHYVGLSLRQFYK